MLHIGPKRAKLRVTNSGREGQFLGCEDHMQRSFGVCGGVHGCLRNRAGRIRKEELVGVLSGRDSGLPASLRSLLFLSDKSVFKCVGVAPGARNKFAFQITASAPVWRMALEACGGPHWGC